jgi:hypothetical protein
MVKELTAVGLDGTALLSEVQRLTGLPTGEAMFLIAVETGRVTVPQHVSMQELAQELRRRREGHD